MKSFASGISWLLLTAAAFGQGTLAIETDLVDVTVNRKVIVETGIEFNGDRLSDSRKPIEEQAKTEKAGRVVVSDEVDPKFVVVVVSKSWDEEVAAQYYRDKTWLFVGSPGRYKVEVFTTDPESGSRRTFSYVTLPGAVDPPDKPIDPDKPDLPPANDLTKLRDSIQAAAVAAGDPALIKQLSEAFMGLQSSDYKTPADYFAAVTLTYKTVMVLRPPPRKDQSALVKAIADGWRSIDPKTVKDAGDVLGTIVLGLNAAVSQPAAAGFQIINAEPVPFRQPIAPFEGQVSNGYRWQKVCHGNSCSYQWVRQ